MGFFLKSSTFNNESFVEKDFYRDGAPCIVDGLDILNTLCPVSKKTGLRENPLSLIRKLVNDPAKQALLSSIITELPTDNSQSQLDEDSKFEFCAQRLNVGTPAENEILMHHLESVIDLVADSQKAAAAQQAAEKVSFVKSDTEIVDNA